MLKKVIGYSANKQPLVASLKGIAEDTENRVFQLIYTTSELINGIGYNEKQSVLPVQLQKGRPFIKGRGETVTDSGTEPAIGDMQAIPDIDNYQELLNAYKTETHHEWALGFIERNHTA